MTDWIFSFFPGGDMPVDGQRDWALGSEGLAPGWAFFLFLILAAACLYGYWKCAGNVSPFRRRLMAGLRLVAILLFLVLLVKPVLNLTVHQPVRQSLLVLLDTSTSMLLEDQRLKKEDRIRAAIASGEVDPDSDLDAGIPEEAGDLRRINRWDLLSRLSENPRLDLWNRLSEKSDLVFYRFGRDAVKVGELTEEKLAGEQVAALMDSLVPDETSTANGEALRQVLELNRGLPVAGVLMITDGANNSGITPVEVARMMRIRNVPLYLYGIGVTTPTDLMVRSIEAPQISFVEEGIDVRANIRVNGLDRKSVTGVLKVDGEEVDTASLLIRQDGEYDLTFRYDAKEVGEKLLEVSIPVSPEEMTGDNNTTTTKIRVMDKKIRVLYIEQEPRWDFRYLLAYLQRDRRLEVDCVLIDSGPGLEDIPDSPFLMELPSDREELFDYEILILGDVNPDDLGDTRMNLIKQWVAESQGGMIFLAGAKYNPSQYTGTPLGVLLPVIPDQTLPDERRVERELELFDLTLTPSGKNSPYLEMSPDAEENLEIWEKFPGVRWTAAVAKAKPGAEVLLTDSRPDRAVGGALMPVMAVQRYGTGETVFIGTDETYRWRSRTGEVYYSQVWNSIMQSLSINRLTGAGKRTQLQVERERYFVGDRVVISGKIYREGYEPMTVGVLEGELEISGIGPGDEEFSRTVPLNVSAVQDQVAEYQAEFTARTPGRYTYSTLQDPEAEVRFEVVEPKVEQMETALDARLLESMAQTANGHFLREEDLNELPDLVASRSATVASYETFNLFHSPWWLALICFFLFLEWLIRRISYLK